MPKERRSHSLIWIVRNLFQGYYDYIADVIELAKLETQLAIRSIIIIAILGFISFVLTISAWVCLLTVEYWVLITYGFKPLSASIIVFFTNFIFLAVCGISILILKRNLNFTATRKHLTTPLITEKRRHE